VSATAPTLNHEAAAADAADRRKRIRAIIASSSGNLVEWYDFYVYSFLALYFASEFFPKGDQTTQLLNAAGVFAAGFLMRPVGSWIFGRLADRRGRKFSMLVSVLMMCGGSLLVGIIPTYSSIGIWAPVLLTLARMVQGVSVGGEYGTSATYMSEVARSHNRGFLASFQYVTLIGGQLLALLVLICIQQFLSEAEIKAWGWRIPFFIGALAALVALYLRSTLHETANANTLAKKEAGTFSELMKHKRSLLTVLGFTAGGSLAFYTYTTYMQKYLVNTAGMPKETASFVMTAALVVYMVMQPIFGALSDRIGRRNCMLGFGLLVMLSTVPLLSALGHVHSPVVAFLLIVLALAFVSLYTSISGLVKAELFPMEVRALGVGVSYAIGNALFGGTAEAVALGFKQQGIESTFYWYVSALAALALITAWLMPDAKHRSSGVAHDMRTDGAANDMRAGGAGR
jgi:MHS family alpha-ketoglutarate permease-like MFS transporter